MALCFHNISAETGLYGGLFLAGLAGGFTHCILMCGPFAVAQSGNMQARSGFLNKIRHNLLLPYHLGRMTTYVMLAVIFSTIFNAAFFFSPLKNVLGALLLLTAALIFLIHALPALGHVFPYLVRATLPVPRAFIMKVTRPFIVSKTLWKRYVLGILLGFMPCGLVVAAFMTVVMLENPLKAAIGMALFSIGTIPALVIAAAGGGLAYARFPRAVPAFRIGALAISSCVLLITAGRMILS